MVPFDQSQQSAKKHRCQVKFLKTRRKLQIVKKQNPRKRHTFWYLIIYSHRTVTMASSFSLMRWTVFDLFKKLDVANVFLLMFTYPLLIYMKRGSVDYIVDYC